MLFVGMVFFFFFFLFLEHVVDKSYPCIIRDTDEMNFKLKVVRNMPRILRLHKGLKKRKLASFLIIQPKRCLRRKPIKATRLLHHCLRSFDY